VPIDLPEGEFTSPPGFNPEFKMIVSLDKDSKIETLSVGVACYACGLQWGYKISITEYERLSAIYGSETALRGFKELFNTLKKTCDHSNATTYSSLFAEMTKMIRELRG